MSDIKTPSFGTEVIILVPINAQTEDRLHYVRSIGIRTLKKVERALKEYLVGTVLDWPNNDDIRITTDPINPDILSLKIIVRYQEPFKKSIGETRNIIREALGIFSLELNLCDITTIG